MNTSRGLTHVNGSVGTFVLAGILVAGLGIFLAGRAQGWFERTQVVRSRAVPLTADSTIGLERGAEVQILGSPAGVVQDVEVYEETTGPSPGLRLRFTMQLRGDRLDLVRRDSKVIVQRRFGVAGTAYVQITPGRAEAPDAQTELECVVARDLTKALEESLDTINRPDGPLRKSLANLETVTANIAAGKGTVGQLLSDDATANSLKATLANVEKISTNLATGEGAAGMLLSDGKARDKLDASIDNIRQSTESLQKLMTSTDPGNVPAVLGHTQSTLVKSQAALEEFTQTTAALRQQVKELPALISQTQEMMRQTTRMLEAMQRSWLLRDYVTPESGPRLKPTE